MDFILSLKDSTTTIIIALFVVLTLWTLNYFFGTRYYKHHTVIMYMESQGGKHHRMFYLDKGYRDKKGLFIKIEEVLKDAEKTNNKTLILTRVDVFKCH